MTPARVGLRAEAHPRWLGDDVGYRGAHKRVEAAKGRADAHACVDCGEPATGWSLSPNTPGWALRSDPRGYLYSTDVDCYDSRCHYLRDHMLRTREPPAQVVAASWLLTRLVERGGVAPVSELRAEAAAAGIPIRRLEAARTRYTRVVSVPIPGTKGFRRWGLPEAFEMEEADAV